MHTVTKYLSSGYITPAVRPLATQCFNTPYVSAFLNACLGFESSVTSENNQL